MRTVVALAILATATGLAAPAYADSLAFSRDGKRLAWAAGLAVGVWDTVTGQGRRLAGHVGSATRVAFAPDGKTLASGGTSGAVHLWDPLTGRALGNLTGLPRPVG